jgi:hypothetical protein
MTDENVTREFEKWCESVVCTKEEESFYDQYKPHEQELALGFYAGFRAAERLAKIEVLEEIIDTFRSNGSKVTTMVKIERMLSELKAGQ